MTTRRKLFQALLKSASFHAEPLRRTFRVLALLAGAAFATGANGDLVARFGAAASGQSEQALFSLLRL